MNAVTIRERAEALERALGDPWNPGTPAGYQRTLEHDERETFPQAAWDQLVDNDYFAGLVPGALGGQLERFDLLLQMGRVVCRRDVTLGVAAGQCLLASLPIWIGGSEAQRTRVAELLREGQAGGLALTEQAHGSDLAGGELRAAPDTDTNGGGYRLDGEKWCINNGSRGAFVTVLARTAAEGGPRGFSLFCVEKALIKEGLEAIPRLATHGVRGADISGVRFTNAPVPGEMRVGKAGAGLPLVLRTMQVSRTMCAAFSLGAADSALRLATTFASERRLYGASILELAPVRARLALAHRRLLLADAIAHIGARALSVIPEQMSVLSAVVKIAVPRLACDAIAECATVLGARHYLRTGPYGSFQKIMRDAALIALFDGSAEVNQSIIAGQLARIAGARSDELVQRGDVACENMAAIASLDDPVPAMRWNALKTSNRGRDDLLTALLHCDSSAGQPMLTALRMAALEVDAASVAAAERGNQPALHALADRYVWLVVAAAVAHLDAAAPACTGDALARPKALIRDALRLAGVTVDPGRDTNTAHGHEQERNNDDGSTSDATLDGLLARHAAGMTFGVQPFRIADGTMVR